MKQGLFLERGEITFEAELQSTAAFEDKKGA